MIIVSQDKLRISKNLEIEIYPEYAEDNEKEIIGYTIENDYSFLGKYKTEERAKEVLREIIQTKSNFEYYKYADESERNELDPFMKTKYEFFDVYEMPKE